MTTDLMTWEQGPTGRIVLDRPSALNALSYPMLDAMASALNEWSTDDDVKHILMSSSSQRAFCAGGDVVAVAHDIIEDNHRAAHDFFALEYKVNQTLAQYPKPVVSLISGYNFGGGLGISVHGTHRLVTEEAAFAMPEVTIGFIPDVGSSWFLPRLAGCNGKESPALGRWMALTGARLSAADALWVGLATHFIPVKYRLDIPREMRRSGLEKTLTKFARDPEEAGVSQLSRDAEDIESAFGRDSLDEVLHALTEPQYKGEWVAYARRMLSVASPTALVATWELLEAGENASRLSDCFAHELALGDWMRWRPDFVEGVRAQLIDKDEHAEWIPPSIKEVSQEEIRQVLAL